MGSLEDVFCILMCLNLKWIYCNGWDFLRLLNGVTWWIYVILLFVILIYLYLFYFFKFFVSFQEFLQISNLNKRFPICKEPNHETDCEYQKM